MTGVMNLDSMMVLMDSKYSECGWESHVERERERERESRVKEREVGGEAWLYG